MRRYLPLVKNVAVILSLGLSSLASAAATLCVTTSGPAYARPSISKVAGEPSVTQLLTGSTYVLVHSQAQWVQVKVGTSALWADSSLFGPLEACTSVKTPKSTSITTRTTIDIDAAGTRQGLSVSEQTRTSTISITDCACEAGNTCIGPRGGRYCLTSEGKKRYGK